MNAETIPGDEGHSYAALVPRDLDIELHVAAAQALHRQHLVEAAAINYLQAVATPTDTEPQQFTRALLDASTQFFAEAARPLTTEGPS